MNKRGFRRVAVFASAAALAGGAVAGCGSDAATTNGTGAQQTGQPSQGGGGMDFTALAKTLGVTTEKLQAAMAKNRPEAGQQPGSGADMAANLAKELGLSESKVAAALKDLMPQGGPPAGGQAPPDGQAAPSATPAAGTSS